MVILLVVGTILVTVTGQAFLSLAIGKPIHGNIADSGSLTVGGTKRKRKYQLVDVYIE